MNTTSLILTLAVASLLSLGGSSTVSRTVGLKKAPEVSPQKITVMYGNVPVSLAVDTFQMPLSQLF
jgi:hypothetical protein